MRKKNNYWNFENCKLEALKYKTRTNFKEKSRSAYNSALRNKWLDEICKHMNYVKRYPFGYWTKEKCHEKALLYNSKS